MQKKGLLIIISGPSGVGKGSVLKRAREKYDNFKYSVSVTTRDRRDEEVEGVNYYYRSVEQFNKMVANGEFLEHMTLFGNQYGTPVAGVRKNLEDGYDLILEIDTQGALEVKKIFPDCVTVFIVAKSVAIIKERLTGRDSETPEQRRIRLTNALHEFEKAPLYDYIVLNDVLEQCADDVLSIINAEKGKLPSSEVEKFKTINNKKLIDNLLMEANNYDD